VWSGCGCCVQLVNGYSSETAIASVPAPLPEQSPPSAAATAADGGPGRGDSATAPVEQGLGPGEASDSEQDTDTDAESQSSTDWRLRHRLANLTLHTCFAFYSYVVVKTSPVYSVLSSVSSVSTDVYLSTRWSKLPHPSPSPFLFSSPFLLICSPLHFPRVCLNPAKGSGKHCGLGNTASFPSGVWSEAPAVIVLGYSEFVKKTFGSEPEKVSVWEIWCFWRLCRWLRSYIVPNYPWMVNLLPYFYDGVFAPRCRRRCLFLIIYQSLCCA